MKTVIGSGKLTAISLEPDTHSGKQQGPNKCLLESEVLSGTEKGSRGVHMCSREAGWGAAILNNHDSTVPPLGGSHHIKLFICTDPWEDPYFIFVFITSLFYNQGN